MTVEILSYLGVKELCIELQSELTEDAFLEVLTRHGLSKRHYEDIRRNLYRAYSTGALHLIVLQGKFSEFLLVFIL